MTTARFFLTVFLTAAFFFRMPPLSFGVGTELCSTNDVSEKGLKIAAENPPAVFYVASDGSDDWSGTRAEPNAERTDGPFATLTRAQRAVRQRMAAGAESGVTVVEVHGGIYELTETLTFTAADGGSEDRPVIWRAVPGEEVRIVGGKYLKGIHPVTDPKALSLIREDLRDQLIEVDLAAQGINDPGLPDGKGMELFFRGEPTRIARYPNAGFIKITGFPEDSTPFAWNDIHGVREGIFSVDDDEVTCWSGEEDIWLNGYWCWDWSNERCRVESIDPATKTIRIRPPYHGGGYRLDQWFYAYNLLSELDIPGEMFFDRTGGKLFFYPGTDIADGDLMLTGLTSLLLLEGVSHWIWQGFIMEGTRGDTVTVKGGVGNLIVGCVIRNSGGWAVNGQGEKMTVFGCHLYNMGRGGVTLTGGDRETLSPGQNRIVNNEIHAFGRLQRVYTPGADVNGVGNVIAHNKIYDAPHMGIGFSGCDELLEFNEIYNVCYESNDAGAIYTGRSWTSRGHLLRGNYLHDITGFEQRGCRGVYLDDMFSSAEVTDNLFRNVTRAVFLGGGRDNRVINNVFIDCKPTLYIDARGTTWGKGMADGWVEEAQSGRLGGISFREAPYADRYPELASMFDEGKNPNAPEGCVVERNIVLNGMDTVPCDGDWKGDLIDAKALPFVTLKGNVVDLDPKFVDPDAGDYSFQSDSPVLKHGIRPIPFREMGLYDSPLRWDSLKMAP